MPLILPKSISVNNFNGGYNSNGNQNTLGDSQTNDAENVEILTNGAIAERRGYRRMFNQHLGIDSTSATAGSIIRGHSQIIKSGELIPLRKEVVAAGGTLYDYNSQTASVIATNLDSANFWFFTQIQDPRSASNDVLIGVNGEDEPKVWDGVESSAVNLSDLTSATGVLPAKFVQSLKNRIYLLNVKDNADVDSNVKVLVSAFSDQGAPRPQRFEQNFFVGGSDKQGEITGATVLHDQLIIFKRNSTYKFTPGSGRIIDTAQLVQMDEQVGCIAPGTVAVAGNVAIFLGELGVFTFDGNNFQYLSNNIEPDLLDTNRKFIQNSQGVYYRKKNQYWLAVPSSGAEHPDTIFVYDLTKGIWFPPYTGLNSTRLSVKKDVRDEQFVVAGDQYGFLFKHDIGFSDGVTATFTGTITGITGSNSIIVDDAANFPTDGDGIGGAKVRITAGTGQGKEFTVIATSATNTLRIAPEESAIGLDSSSEYVLGAIVSHYRTKDFDFGVSDTDKKYRKITTRVAQKGDHNLNVQYLVDFNPLNVGPTATISLLKDSAIWGTSTYDTARFGKTNQLTREISLRAIPGQSLTGKNFAVRFSNNQPFQPWEVSGFDIQLKEIGRR